ncbi:hypothetical protein P170DRAFT_188311 [Aspergillus steynii IBT 23096]|uniref:Uncharacterized protein n=1 Tax=Aspergillus steynii IBT 23096 TaxID=1392250 RepID=A0A2I2G9K4_9EURO|nr:uncharacterized protein P170DRAFT_188311 [Aspergillus steynii IBT 23096]PLB49560.1 hypothetical protein P170DRAFT_188311 [Aspergillus steynii IBT 23096]
MDLAVQSKRPRRSSFTQHLQRVLHLDKGGNSDNVQARAGLETRPVSYQQTHSKRMSDEQESHIATRTNACDYQPHAPLSSINAAPHETESRFYTTQDFASGSLEHADKSPFTKEALGSSNGGNVTSKKDRRATMRLEADRIELEKRLLKLEQAGNAQDSTALRRESRRLTKKQPLGSSSRTSSASADDTKSYSRFSSVFSRRTSRSRSSSMNGGDNGSSRRQSIGTEVTTKDESPVEPRHCTASPVPITLPVRLGAAISKGLAVTNNALLSHPKESAQSQAHHSHSGATSLDTSVSVNDQPTLGDGVASHAGHGSNPHGETDPKKASLVDSHISSDLDRASFAATLKLGRDSDIMQTEASHKQNTKARRKPSTTPGTNHGADISDSQLITPSLHPSLMRNAPTRSLAENMPQRHSKKFTSSPLAGAPTVNDLDCHSVAASIESTKLRAPTAASDKRTSGTKGSHALFSSHTTDKPNGPGTGAHSSPLDITNQKKNTNSFSSSHLLESSSSGGRPSLDSGEIATSSHAKKGSMSTLNNHKTKLPNQSIGSPLRKESQRWHFPGYVGQGERAATEPASEKARPRAIQGHTKAEGHPELKCVNAEQNSPSRDTKMSNLSLSTSVSQDQGSEEYNTADEAVSVPSPSRDEDAPAQRPVDYFSARTLRGSAQGSLEKKSPMNVLSSAVLPRSQGPSNQAKYPVYGQSVAKLFVICCHCKSWHDMPSEVYRKLAFSAVSHASTDRSFASSGSQITRSNSRHLSKKSTNAQGRSSRNTESSSQKKPESASAMPPPFLAVKCCWCEHRISKTCCQAWTTAVHLCEKQS